MYRTLVIGGGAAADLGALRVAEQGMRTGVIAWTYAENYAAGLRRADELRPDLVLLPLEKEPASASQAIEEWALRQPQARLIALLASEVEADADAPHLAKLAGQIEAAASAGQVVDVVLQVADKLAEERLRREAELRVAEITMEFLPLAEQEIALGLMLADKDSGSDRETELHRLLGALGVTVKSGCAAVIELPQTEGRLQLPAGMGAQQLYEAVRSSAKSTAAFIVVGPVVHRWLVLLRLPGRSPQGARLLDEAEAWAQAVHRFLAESLGLSCRIALGGVYAGLPGLRRSLREASAVMGLQLGEQGAASLQEELARQIGELRGEREERLRRAYHVPPDMAASTDGLQGASSEPLGVSL